MHSAMLRLKKSEQTRYEKWLAEVAVTQDDQVSEWEHREYFATY